MSHHQSGRAPPRNRPSQSRGAAGNNNSSQWPLRDNGDAQSGASNPSQRQQPRRPPRPNEVPLILGPPRPAVNRGPPMPQTIPQYHQDISPPVKQYAHQDPITSWVNDVSPTYSSSDIPKPFAESQRDSTGSSVYSVPEFPTSQASQAPPVPQHQIVQPPRPLYLPNRRPPLGPPPSARKGPASYYPQSNYVTPIVEETDSQRGLHDSKSSFSSGNAIPIGISRHLANQHQVSRNDESPFDDQDDDSDLDDVEQIRPIPVRQASIGRKSVPTLTTIKNNDLRPDSQTRPLGYTGTHESTGSMFTVRSMRPSEPSIYNEPEVPEIHFPMADASPEERSEKSMPQLSTRTSSSDILGNDATVAKAPYDSEKTMYHQPSRERLPTEFEMQSAPGSPTEHDFEKSADPASEKPKTLAQRVGSRRPPRLNVDAVREAEARGSLTSLPDLIRRATKVASNLDRGRTASRLGLNFFDDEQNKAYNPDKRRSGTSLSDILASFPPPGLATPPGSRGSRAMQWPSHLRHTSLPSESDPGEVEKRQRRCCGMPLWLFLTLLLIVLIIVAAAVIIPIVLVVVPRQREASNTASASALASCQKSLSCQNGGVNILGSDGSCSCLCVNGFAGAKCAESSSASCTTTTIGSVSNVTLGDSIPRLLTGAESNFSIPLNASNIVGLFSSSNLTCTSENALVTFNDLSARSIPEDAVEILPTKTLSRRADSTAAVGAAVTSNGIVFASGSASDTPSTTASAFSSDTSELSSSSSETLDFARVAVLLVLQESGKLSEAITAQETLQEYFTSGTSSTGQQLNASSIDLGSGFTANLEQQSIRLSNGTVVGG